mgnify:CR=1 FL=1
MNKLLILIILILFSCNSKKSIENEKITAEGF